MLRNGGSGNKSALHLILAFMFASVQKYLVLAQTDFFTIKTLPECMAQTQHFFCNRNDVTVSTDNLNTNLYEGEGYCCPSLSFAAECTHEENGLDCTYGDRLIIGEPIYKTYWVGMTPQICNSDSVDLTVDTFSQKQVAENMVLAQREDTDYEACYWILSVEEDKYRDDTGAYIEVFFDKLDKAEAFIYEGTDRRNFTHFIENNDTAIAGVPYRAPISDKLIIVMYTSSGGISGSGSFTYQLFDAEEYPFYFKPFIGLSRGVWYTILFATISSPIWITCLSVCICTQCACCYKCCR